MSTPESPLGDLLSMQLTESEWGDVHEELAALEGNAPDLTRQTQIVFEAKVRQKFHAGRSSSTLAPTKQTSALPWVGAVCGLLLLVVGTLLGGGAILVVIVVLSLGVMGVAVAGSRVAHRRLEAQKDEDIEETVPIPPAVRAIVERLETAS